jgi:hypothetical protein
MKRHYEIMRIMRTKILSMSELEEGAEGITCIYIAIQYRVQDLTRVSISPSTVAGYVNLIRRELFSTETRSRETVPRLCFWDCGLCIISRTALPSHVLTLQFKYCHNENALWSVNYIRSLDPQVIPYNDDNEDQTVQPGDILNHGYKDELSLDYSVYDEHSIDHIPNCRDIDPLVEDMYALRLMSLPRTF